MAKRKKTNWRDYVTPLLEIAGLFFWVYLPISIITAEVQRAKAYTAQVSAYTEIRFVAMAIQTGDVESKIADAKIWQCTVEKFKETTNRFVELEND